MLKNLIFSLNSALPIFFVLLAGFVLRRRHFIDDSFIRQANRLVFYIALPVKLFFDVGQTTFQGAFDWSFILFIVAGTVLSIPLCALAAALLVKDKSKRGAFIQGSFRGNFLYVGYSLIENVMGTVGAKAPIAFAFIVPLYNILAVMVLAWYGGSDKEKITLRSVLKSIGTNPLILSITAGVLFSGLGLSFPVLLERSFSYFGVLVTPLALLMIGASFQPGKIRENFSVALLASLLKLAILPLAAVYAAWNIGFDSEDIIVIYTVFGVPTATVSYIMALIMDADHDLASSIIMLTTFLSTVSMTLFIFAFRSLGII